MDRFKVIFCLLALWPCTGWTEVEVVSPSPKSNIEEVIISREGNAPIQIVHPPAETPLSDLKIQVLPVVPALTSGKIVAPTPAPDLQESAETEVNHAGLSPVGLSDDERRELWKWRLLSHRPIRLTLIGGTLQVEWAEAKKTVSMTEHQTIEIQLAPQ